MNIMKLQLKMAARIEFLATGFYESLAKRYSKKEDIADTMAVFSKDEYRHGLMFRKALNDEFGKSVMAGPWIFFGKTLAFLQYLIPLRWKLKTLSVIESLALAIMKKDLKADPPNRYQTIVRKINPDEIRHASYYESLYGRKVTEKV